MMNQQHREGRVVPYPKVKRFLEAAIRVTNRKPMIHGLFEVDVTRARTFLRDHKARTGETLSFTAFIMTCLGKAVDEHKEVQAMRNGSTHLIIFDDVDVLTYIEREMAGEQIILPYIVRTANRKTFREIHREIRTAQVQDLGTFERGGGKAMRLLPAALFLPYFWITTWIGKRNPRMWKKTWGTVMLSTVGMCGEGAGWGIPLSPPTLCWITVGGIGQKREDVDGQRVIREDLSLTVSFDHNLIDGAPAARFTERFKELIESGHGLVDQQVSAALPIGTKLRDSRSIAAHIQEGERAMTHVQGEIIINRSVEEVFDFVADERNEPRYNSAMVRSDLITGEPIGVGSRFQATMTGRGRVADMTIEFTTFERPRRLASSTHLSTMEIDGMLTFEPVPEGTRMRWFWVLQPHGVLKFLTPLVTFMGRRQEKTIWTGLKRYLESREVSIPSTG